MKKRLLLLSLASVMLLSCASCATQPSAEPQAETPQGEEQSAVPAADYSAVAAALAAVPEDLSGYTKKSAEAVQTAVASVRYGLSADDQAELDAAAAAIQAAVAGLSAAPHFDNLEAIIFYVDSLGIDFSDLASFSMDGLFEDAVLCESADAGEAYANETVYIGDSITDYMNYYSELPSENIYGVPSINPQNAAEDPLVTLKDGTSATFAEAMAELQPKRIVITIGTNSMLMESIEYLRYFAQFVEQLKAACPKAQIIIQSTSPLTAEYEAGMRLLTNRNINRSNLLLAGLCVYENIYFLNSAEALKNESGTLDSAYDLGEGYGHLNRAAYAVWVTYLRTHAVTE